LTKQAFVVGNGTSRSTVDLAHLKLNGKMYGCNALYREFDPDYLIAVDVKMIIEINKSGYQLKTPVWTNSNKAYHKFVGFNYFQPSKGWSSGPTALWMASEHDNDEIYILGFDYQGLGDTVNNIYADSPNYKRSTDKATYFGNWLKQTVITVKENPNIQYVRVIEKEGFIPPDLVNIDNIKHITVDDFKNRHGLM